MSPSTPRPKPPDGPRRATWKAEHTDLIHRAPADIDRMTREARQRRTELDRRAEQVRAQAQADFDLTMSARRAELEADLARRRAHADAEFDHHADALRDEMTRLCRLRDAIRAQLGVAERLVADVVTNLDADEPQPELSQPLPTQRTDTADTSHQVTAGTMIGTELAAPADPVREPGRPRAGRPGYLPRSRQPTGPAEFAASTP